MTRPGGPQQPELWKPVEVGWRWDNKALRQTQGERIDFPPTHTLPLKGGGDDGGSSQGLRRGVGVHARHLLLAVRLGIAAGDRPGDQA